MAHLHQRHSKPNYLGGHDNQLHQGKKPSRRRTDRSTHFLATLSRHRSGQHPHRSTSLFPGRSRTAASAPIHEPTASIRTLHRHCALGQQFRHCPATPSTSSASCVINHSPYHQAKQPAPNHPLKAPRRTTTLRNYTHRTDLQASPLCVTLL